MIDIFTPLTVFIFLGLFSPGPNVILLTTSGARFGFAKTLPHIFGVAIGVGIISAFTGLGVGAFLTNYPSLSLILKFISFSWILYMAFRLWHAEPTSTNPANDRPFTFFEAVMFQWINPKAWAVTISATAYTIGAPALDQALQLGLSFTTINFGVCLFWTGAGTLLSYLLNNATAWRVFVRTMAVLLAVFSVMIFL